MSRPRAGEGCFSAWGRIIQGLISCSCNASTAQSADRDSLSLKLFIRSLGTGGLWSKTRSHYHGLLLSLKGQKPTESQLRDLRCVGLVFIEFTAQTVVLTEISASCKLEGTPLCLANERLGEMLVEGDSEENHLEAKGFY